MRDITLEELLSAGCHFGHQVNRRNPRADEFIFEARSNIHIIDLVKTREGLMAAAEFVKDLSAQNGYMIVVGTKRQARAIVEEEFKRATEALGQASGLFYVTTRWVGGTFTNFSEVTKNFKKLKELNSFLASGQKQEYTKREVLLMERERDKLRSLYGGVENLDRIPDAVFIIDTHLERIAVSEARNRGVKIIGIIDTNSDPSEVDYPIPANDDAVGSIKIIASYIMDAWIEGKQKKEDQEQKEENAEKSSKRKTQSAKRKATTQSKEE